MLVPSLLLAFAPQDPCFQPPQTILLAGTKSAALAAGDLDGDGVIDLVAAESPLGLRVVLDAAGSASLGAQVALPGTSLNDVALGDLDGDGALDVVAADLHGGTGVHVAYGGGAGALSSPTALASIGAPSPYALQLADFDADGRLDVAAVQYFDHANGLELWTQATGGFGASTTWPTAAYPNGLAAADVDLDGLLDAVIATRNGQTVETLLGDGAGAFPARETTHLPVAAIGLDVGDVDGDGLPDVVVTQPDDDLVLLLSGDGTGAFPSEGEELHMGNFPGSVSILDVNGDSLLDLVAGVDPGGSIRLATTPGAFDWPFLVDTGAQSANLLVHDLNADGRPDLAAGDLAAADVTITLAGCLPSITAVQPTAAAMPAAILVEGEHLDAVTAAFLGCAPAAILAQTPTSIVLQPAPAAPGFTTLKLASPHGAASAPAELWPSLRSLGAPVVGAPLELEVDQGEIGVYHLAFSTGLLPEPLELPALPATYGLRLDFLQPGFTVLPAGLITTDAGAVVAVPIPEQPSLTGLEVHVQALTWGTCFPIGCSASFSNVLSLTVEPAPN